MSDEPVPVPQAAPAADFRNISQAAISASSRAKYTFYELEGEPWIEVKPAGQANGAYFNAVLRRSRKGTRRIAAGKIDAGMIKKNRDDDRALFPKLVVTGWGNVMNSAGELVPYSEGNCMAFLAALPDDLFDDLRNYAGAESNFRDEAELDEDEVEDISGNSESGSSGS